jgi:glyoxylase-like metal-dependent hydrolase (beta-lactamase superfamily II)
MTHRLNLFLLGLPVVLGLPYYVLLIHNPSRDVAPFPLQMADLRRMAAVVPGPQPQTIAATFVGWDRTPGNLLAAGSGIKRRLFTVMSFRLDTPGGKPLVIDTGTTGPLASRANVERFREGHQRRVDADLAAAGTIIATDESAETLGGLARFAKEPAGAAALGRALLNPAQLPAATRGQGLPWPAQLTLPAAIGREPRAIAPGVVVIPTAAPTPGSQMVYVRLADGREYLFAGPVAPYGVNATELRTRSLLTEWWDGPTDRAVTMRWLVTLQHWQKQAPRLFVVTGHDGMALLDADHPSGILLRD